MTERTLAASFDVAGVTLTLRAASVAEVRAVSRQLGLDPTEPEAAPDVVVEYAPALDPEGPLTHVELGRFGWTAGTFWLWRGLGGRRVRVTLDPAALDLPLRLRCERRGVGIPLLTQLLGTVTAAKGNVAVHAAAFELRGRNVLVTGWSDSGKTEAMLAALDRGGRPIGDDIVYLDGATGRLRGLPVAVRLKAWHVEELPDVRRRAGGRRGLLLRAHGPSAWAARRVASGPGATAADHAMRKVATVLGRLLTASVPLDTVTGGVAAGGDGHELHDVVLVTSSTRTDVLVEPADPRQVAARVQASLQEERANLVHAYRQLRYAFPGARSELLDRVDERELAVLTRTFERVRAWHVDHPHPVGLAELGAALDRIVE